MNALELAYQIEAGAAFPAYPPMPLVDAAAMLRRQHEAIKQLREALSATSVALRIGHNTLVASEQAQQALKDTEEFK